MSLSIYLTLLLAAGSGGEVAAANNAFAVDLYHQVSGGDRNLFFSPLSLSTALAMTYAGAEGETAQDMAKVLHFPPDSEQVHASFGGLLRGMGGEHPYRLDIANALWLEKEQAFLKPFLDAVQENYGAGLFEVDFAGASEAARKQINAWVEKQTADKIKDLIPPGQVDSATRLVLTNAVYFKGKWQHPFPADGTADGPFRVSVEKTVQAPLMRQTVRVPYLKGEGFQAVTLPYTGENLAMLVVLPDEVDGLGGVEDSLSADTLNGWMSKAPEQQVDLVLPRFKATSQFDLKKELSILGMARSFGPGADFSRMTGAKELFISAVLHKAYVDVNEEGTEAAAATAVPMTKSMAARPKVFHADHPFLFAIFDKTGGTVLFLGRLVDPTAGG